MQNIANNYWRRRSLLYYKRIIVSILDFFTVFSFTLIIFYVITNGFTYSFLELFGTCIEVHNLWRPLAVLVLLIGIKKLLKKIWDLKEEKLFFERSAYFFITALIVFLAFVIPTVLRKYYSFSIPHPQDLALYNQAIYNTVHGHPLATTCFGYIFHNWNLLADHAYLILLLLTPFYYFSQGAHTLLIIQTIVIVLGAIPVYIIARDKLKNEWAGLGISIIYLLYPLITKFYFSGFRADYLAMVFLLYAFLSLEKKRINYLYIFIILAIICKEDVFITTTLIGFYIAFFKRDIKGHFKIGFLIAASSILYSIFLVKFIMPGMTIYARSGHCAYNKIQGVCASIPSLLTRFTNSNNLLFTLSVFLNHIRSLGYIPLFSPLILLCIGTFAENVYPGYNYAVQVWFSAIYVPILFISFIYGIKNLLKLINRRFISLISVKYLFWVWALGVPIIAGLMNFNCDILPSFNESNNENRCKPSMYDFFAEAAGYLPKDGSLIPQFQMLPNLSNRREFYLWLVSDCIAKYKGRPDYLFYSTKIPYSSDGENSFFNNLLSSGGYEEICDSGGFIVMARKDRVSKKIKRLFDFSDKDFINNYELNACNVIYKKRRGIGGTVFYLYFDEDGGKDEYLQMRFGRITPMKIEKNDYLEVNYKLEDIQNQTFEVVLGVDINGDGKVDSYITRLCPKTQKTGRYSRYRLDLYAYLKEKFPNNIDFSISEIEFYPHKMWWQDCSCGRARGWYNFWVKDLKIINLTAK